MNSIAGTEVKKQTHEEGCLLLKIHLNDSTKY